MGLRPQGATPSVSTGSKPNVLFVTPWMPRPTGSGPAMRAYYSLRALSRTYEPYVLIVGVYERDNTPEPPPDGATQWKWVGLQWRRDFELVRRGVLFESSADRYFDRYEMPSEWRFATDRRVAVAAQAFAGVGFDLIHVFRLYATPYAQPYAEASPGTVTQLDLDEVESSTRKRLADLCEMNGDSRSGRRFRRDAVEYLRVERAELSKWGRVLVSSEVERDRLKAVADLARVDILPNVYPARPLPPSREQTPFRFLFVGQLGYDPNADALRWFVRNMWPLIRERATPEVAFDVVGAGAPRPLARELKSTAGVRYWGRLDTLDRVYKEAGAVIVPLRAGGGTRIKVLEAFARGVPVVATTVGVEGLDVVAGRDLLIADSETDFAAAGLRLAAETNLRQELRKNAHHLCEDHYQPEAMAEVLAPSVKIAGTMIDR